jgi:tetratricopeptide (TPR) repeat protein
VDARTRGPDVLAQLRRERLIRSTGVSADDEVEAYHDRIRETVIARLDPSVRASWHRRLGTALEQHGDADAETVAVHFVHGGLPERAWPHFRDAAQAAARALAFDRAASLYEQALTHHVGPSTERTQLLLSLGEVRANGGRGRPAAEAFDAAAALATTDAERLDRLRMAAAQLCVSGAVDLGRERFRDVLRGVGLRPAQSAPGILAQLAFRRARLRVRGLSFTPRAEQAVPATLLRRLDTLWAASRGLSSVDVVGVAALQSQALLFALEAGEPRRLALALAWEAVMVATSGVSAAPRAEELLRLARSLAHRTEDEATHAMMQLSTGWVAFLQGRFPQALQICTDAEAVFRDRCVGVWWELLLSRTLLAWSAAHMGRLPELSTMIRQWEPQARARGDHFLVTNLLSYAMPVERMLRDDVTTVRAHVREALALWPYEGFHLQHVSVLFSEGLLALYEGDGATACAAISARWRVMVSTLQTQNQQTRVMLRDVRARGALQAAVSGIERASHLAQVERDARALLREDAPWARAYGQRLQAGLALARGDREGAVALFERALPALDDSGLALHAAVVRRRLGELQGGTDGQRLIAQSNTLMRERGVVNIDATARVYGVG